MEEPRPWEKEMERDGPKGDDADVEMIEGDLFESEGCLCHCVSEDMSMSKGIAVEFKKRFGRVDELRRQRVSRGGVAYIKEEGGGIGGGGGARRRYVYYLVTKDRYWQKPRPEDLSLSLMRLKDLCYMHGVTVLSMPKIACGLDGMRWDDVRALIGKTFRGTGIRIEVYEKQ